MFWVLKRTISLRRFFWVPTTYVFGWEIRKSLFGTHSQRPVHDKCPDNVTHIRLDKQNYWV